MSEKSKEQHPLLCDEESDEEVEEYQHRYRPLVYKGRARLAARGATIIVTRWPEHWTSLVGFWWLAVGMFVISTFIIYRTIIAFAVIPSAYGRPSYSHSDSYYNENSTSHIISNVYMHVLVNKEDEVNLDTYIPHIERFAKNYSEFNFKLIFVLKDATTDSYLSAEEKNTIAFNSLWENEKEKQTTVATKNNIQIEHTKLSKCMDLSPLRKHWIDLPPQFLEFLVRAASVWEKGGIAINPGILTPRTPNVKYMDKLNNILNSYGKHNSAKLNLPSTDKKINPQKKDRKVMRKVNNIRDIIENLENDNSLPTQDTLIGAEDTSDAVVIPSKRKLLSTSLQDVKNNIHIEAKNHTYIDPQFIIDPIKIDSLKSKSKRDTTTDTKSIVNNSLPLVKLQKQTPQMSKSPSVRMLPLFFEFIFKDKVQFDEPKVRSARQRKSVIPLNIEPKFTTNENKSIEIIVGNPKMGDDIILPKYKPMIVSAESSMLPVDRVSSTTKSGNLDNYDKSQLTIDLRGNIPVDRVSSTRKSGNLDNKYDKSQLTIDLRGNIIATETPCHAFLGTVFSNVVQHTQKESLKDFIIAELSLFCKGLLSSCSGIDLVLL